ncbi:MAG: NAD-dependent epimerase/dehydratase family protein [Candidatus Omnitrophica bacterium]|nr:NAD-dependent epimerase/dehydratase family protein [Candidatus Omnitrophota bacterium]
MKKVLVTGGCGFIGSWCCESYIKKGWQVTSYDNMTKYELMRTGYNTEKARDFNWQYLKNLGVNLVKADIRNKGELFEYAKSSDFIIHTAAQPAVTISMEDLELDFSTNVQGTLNVLEAARQFNIPVVSCATVHVYGNTINQELKEQERRFTREPAEIAEDYPMVGGILTPLHASKSSADTYVKVYVDTYKAKAASFRLTGLYGERQLGGEDHGWVANFSIRAILDLPIRIYGTGKQVRDILYAQDLIEAFEAFYNNPVPGIYNIGGGSLTSISLLECIDLISEILGKDLKVEFHPARLGDLTYFICNIDKAKSFLKWQPKTKPETGVRNLINWIKRNLDLFKK